jgi:hypothetical protein
MSNDTIVMEGPDGRLYEIPREILAQYAVPPERVMELRRRQASTLPPGHLRPGDPLPPGAPPPPAGVGIVEGYHMTFDANGIPTNHVEMLWGDYIDRQGHPAVGWHSHDPVTGNAQ